jgi:hypothetical protein
MDLNGFVRDDGLMFAPYCPRHESRVLLGYESVVDIESTPAGLKVKLRCHCGEFLTHEPAVSEVPRQAGAVAS